MIKYLRLLFYVKIIKEREFLDMMRLKKVRIYADISQKEVAKNLGVAYTSYNTWERENDFIPLKQLDKFCNMFQVSLDYIFGFSDIWEYPWTPQSLSCL